MRAPSPPALLLAALLPSLGTTHCPEGSDCDLPEADEAPFLQLRNSSAKLPTNKTKSSALACAEGQANPNWDTTVDSSCLAQSLPGCMADGVNDACRYCGPPKNGDAAAPTYPACGCLSSGVNTNWETTVDDACTAESMPGCKADGVNDACRYCGPPKNGDAGAPSYPACPGTETETTAAPTTTTAAPTTTQPYCGLYVSLFCPNPWEPGASNPNAEPCNQTLVNENEPYSATTRCELVEGSSDVYIRAQGFFGSSSCFATMGIVYWYRAPGCAEEAKFAAMSIYADGDSTRTCYNSVGEIVEGAWCRSTWGAVYP